VLEDVRQLEGQSNATAVLSFSTTSSSRRLCRCLLSSTV